MAQSPRFKVYTPEGTYIGCTKGADEAVVLARYKGVGSTVRDGHLASDTVYDVGRQPFTNEHAAAADIYVVIDKRVKARSREREAEQKMVERAASMRKKLKMGNIRSGRGVRGSMSTRHPTQCDRCIRESRTEILFDAERISVHWCPHTQTCGVILYGEPGQPPEYIERRGLTTSMAEAWCKGLRDARAGSEAPRVCVLQPEGEKPLP